jgi:hypothetical protein
MDAGAVNRFLNEYLEAFAACVRGEQDVASLMAYYGVPLIITSDDGVIALTTDSDIATVIQSQVDGLRGLRYRHTQVLQSQVTGLNAASALYHASLSRSDDAGNEIDCPTITYVVTDGDEGKRIAMLAAHGN